MLGPMLEEYPAAKVGNILAQRDPKTKKAKVYYCKAPIDCDFNFIVDPTLATAGTAIVTCRALEELGATISDNTAFLTLVAAPEGIEAFQRAYPDTWLFVGYEAYGLNENKYIIDKEGNQVFGDAGDRLCGTSK
jgi:uracil phosphoribosyltransferase